MYPTQEIFLGVDRAYKMTSARVLYHLDLSGNQPLVRHPHLGFEPLMTPSPQPSAGSTMSKKRKKARTKATFLCRRSISGARGPRASVVGSRRATPDGLRRTRLLTKALVAHQMIIVSGLRERYRDNRARA